MGPVYGFLRSFFAIYVPFELDAHIKRAIDRHPGIEAPDRFRITDLESFWRLCAADRRLNEIIDDLTLRPRDAPGWLECAGSEESRKWTEEFSELGKRVHEGRRPNHFEDHIRRKVLNTEHLPLALRRANAAFVRACVEHRAFSERLGELECTQLVRLKDEYNNASNFMKLVRYYREYVPIEFCLDGVPRRTSGHTRYMTYIELGGIWEPQPSPPAFDGHADDQYVGDEEHVSAHWVLRVGRRSTLYHNILLSVGML